MCALQRGRSRRLTRPPRAASVGQSRTDFVHRHRAPSGLSPQCSRCRRRAGHPAAVPPKPRVLLVTGAADVAHRAGVLPQKTGHACGFGHVASDRLNSSQLTRFFTHKRLQIKPAPFTPRDASDRGRGWRVPALTGTPGWDACLRGPPTHLTGRREGNEREQAQGRTRPPSAPTPSSPPASQLRPRGH